jgi:hypothetical protein
MDVKRICFYPLAQKNFANHTMFASVALDNLYVKNEKDEYNLQISVYTLITFK